jgi:hypothetical protein
MATELNRIGIKEEILASIKTRVAKAKGKSGDLARLFWDYHDGGYNERNERRAVLNQYLRKFLPSPQEAAPATTAVFGELPPPPAGWDALWTKEFIEALGILITPREAADFREIMLMAVTGLYDHSYSRRSFRSRSAADYLDLLIGKVDAAINWVASGVSVTEVLLPHNGWVQFDMEKIALSLRRREPEVLALVDEAISGEAGRAPFSHDIVEAIIISCERDYIEKLGNLLLAAKLQEGLRQAILEKMDSGTAATAAYFVKLILDNDLLRFSSVLRAMDTWTGLGYGDAEKASVIKKCVTLAYDVLTQPDKIPAFLASPDVLEVYFALWGLGNNDVQTAQAEALRLLAAEPQYLKLTAWYFISNLNNPVLQHQCAIQGLASRDEETLAWALRNLQTNHNVLSTWQRNVKYEPMLTTAFPEDKAERLRHFAALEEALTFVGKKNRHFTSVFPWTSIELNNVRLVACLLSYAVYDLDPELIRRIRPYFDLMNSDARASYYLNLLNPETITEHKTILLEGVKDKAASIKESVVERLTKIPLTAAETQQLAEALDSKSSGVRKAIMAVLKKQKSEHLDATARTLLAHKKESMKQAALEILILLKQSGKKLGADLESEVALLGTKEIAAPTRILWEEFNSAGESAGLSAPGYSLYEPEAPSLTAHAFDQQDVYSPKELKKLLTPGKDYPKYYDAMEKVFVTNANYEYDVTNYDDSVSKVLLGNNTYRIVPPAGSGDDCKITDLPLAAEFLKAAGDFAHDGQKLADLIAFRNAYSEYNYPEWLTTALPFLKDIESKSAKASDFIKGHKYTHAITRLTETLYSSLETKPFAYCFKVFRSLLAGIGEENWRRRPWIPKEDVYASKRPSTMLNSYYVKKWLELAREAALSDEEFSAFFTFLWNLYLKWQKPLENEAAQEAEAAESSTDDGFDDDDFDDDDDEDDDDWDFLEDDYFADATFSLPLAEILRARALSLIDDNAVYHVLTDGPDAASFIYLLTSEREQGRKFLADYPFLEPILLKVIDCVVALEARRGELPTPLTACASRIQHYEGMEYFAQALAALGQENFYRGYAYGNLDGKKEVLSCLIRRCFPRHSDTAAGLKALLAERGFLEERLAAAAMYAPQWAELIESVIEWPGLKSGVWFYHAHVSEHFSAEKETEVALYSPIPPQNFNDGAFDKDWFLTARQTLGEKRFDLLYGYALYITSGGNQHRRGQLYIDAVLGRLKKSELESEIKSKRNQDKLRCYPLLPFDKKKKNEPLERYEFIQKFAKESKKFGAQRRASETLSVSIALENLALTAGFADVERMSWFLESEKLDSIKALFAPKDMGGDVKLWLELDADGNSEIKVTKNDKPQKSVPAALKKHEYVQELKDTGKDLRDQRSRARLSLETAMINSSLFLREELENLGGNPLLAPLITALVWVTECDSPPSEGCPQSGRGGSFLLIKQGKNGLVSVSATGEESPLEAKTLRLAHPYDFLSGKVWRDWQHYLFAHELKQPFKQVFREYYPLTEDERAEKTISRRYAGHQVQPRKTVALLRGRGWTVDYNEGLQKVMHKENLIVRMYALADWFSPADIEAPTLETVRFFSRDKGENVELDSIPPIIFSEIMRDLDLVVAVAHVGGVDPEASHSTVEMRAAIAAELTRLLGLTNVEFSGNHAKITGILGKYSVHLGSAIAHQEGVGMLAILPVHSQARGRIFLPFADDDPKTAEVMSKILLLAEDGKLKDPSILRQIGV